MKNDNRRTYIVAACLLFLLLALMTAIDMALPSYHIAIKVIKKASVYALVAVSMNLLNGFTGLFGYASTIVSGAGLGYLAQHYGWNHAYIAMIAMALVGMAVFLLMWGAGRDGYETDAE
mgnify:CR=1 FL=1